MTTDRQHPYNRFPQASRTNLPTDQTEPFMEDEDTADAPFTPPEQLPDSAYPKLYWNRTAAAKNHGYFQHGPLYVHEKIHPGSFIASLCRPSEGKQTDMFAVFNGLPENAAYEWYEHQGYWQNRLVHGESKRVMASLAAREGLTGQVQMVYLDPPYNIGFSSNFQLRVDQTETPDTGDDVPEDPLSVKAFRDQYANGIHTYLDNLHAQLVLARSLLTESGSCFVQIGPENLHPVAAVMNEVFGFENHVATIPYITSTNQSTRMLPEVGNWILWFAKNKPLARYHQLFQPLTRKEKLAYMSSYAQVELADGTTRNPTPAERQNTEALPANSRLFNTTPLTSSHTSSSGRSDTFYWHPGRQPCTGNEPAWDNHQCGEGCHEPNSDCPVGSRCGEGCHSNAYPCPTGRQWSVSLAGLHSIAEQGRMVVSNESSLRWKRYEEEIPGRPLHSVWTNIGAPKDKRYIVQTPERIIERCMLMTTDPGDLVLDPTCGSGVTAYVAERWGRRWITIDASRVAIAVARQRLATSLYDYYLLQDSTEGSQREAKISGNSPVPPSGLKDVARGFVLQRIPRVSAATLAYNRKEHIYLVDQPEIAPRKTRVCSPFTVESDRPNRAVPVSDDGSADDSAATTENCLTRQRVLEALPVSGIRHRRSHWQVTSLEESPENRLITHTAVLVEQGEDRDKDNTRRAAFHIAPEDVTVSPGLLNRAAQEAANLVPKVDTLVVLAFVYEASIADQEWERRGRLTVIRAEINRDLTIPGLRNASSDNAFVVIGEPDVELRWTTKSQLELEVRGIDTYNPRLRQIEPGDVKDIHCILTDTDYDGLAFQARRINFPHQTKDRQLQAIQRQLRRQLDENSLERLQTAITIPFAPPGEYSRIAVKVIDRAGMETMRILEVAEANPLS